MSNTIFSSSFAQDPYWDDQAKTLFVAISLILFRYGHEEQINMNTVITTCEKIFSDSKSHKLNSHIFVGFLKHQFYDIYCKIISIFDNADVTKHCILAHFNLYMSIFQRDIVAEMMIDNDIKFEKLVEEKTAIYLVMPDEKLLLSR